MSYSYIASLLVCSHITIYTYEPKELSVLPEKSMIRGFDAVIQYIKENNSA